MMSRNTESVIDLSSFQPYQFLLLDEDIKKRFASTDDSKAVENELFNYLSENLFSLTRYDVGSKEYAQLKHIKSLTADWNSFVKDVVKAYSCGQSKILFVPHNKSIIFHKLAIRLPITIFLGMGLVLLLLALIPRELSRTLLWFEPLIAAVAFLVSLVVWKVYGMVLKNTKL